MKTHRSFKTGSKTIRYTYDGHLKSVEQQAIDKFIGMAYNMSMHAIKQFEKQTAEFQETSPQAKAVLASKLTATKEPLKQAVKQRKVKPQIK